MDCQMHHKALVRSLAQAEMQVTAEQFARDVMLPKLMKKYDQGPPFGGVDTWGRPGSKADYAHLVEMLIDHVERMLGRAIVVCDPIGDGKGDRYQLVDICNLAMMLHRIAFGDPQ